MYSYLHMCNLGKVIVHLREPAKGHFARYTLLTQLVTSVEEDVIKEVYIKREREIEFKRKIC